jgi:class 3 adenylate cyclase
MAGLPTGKPTGTVTFLFTDIQGSTSMWERDARMMQAALARHDEIMRGVVTEHGGHVFKFVGDACYAAFASAPDALRAGLAAQRAIFSEPWDERSRVRVRMALHTGEAEERDGDYFGPPLNRVARLLSAAHGGQTLLSRATRELVDGHLPEGVSLRDMGERRLKDLKEPERIFQLLAPGLPSESPP